MSDYLIGVLTLPVAAVLLGAAWLLLSLLTDYGVRAWQVFGHESTSYRRARWAAMVGVRRSVWGLRVGRRTAVVFLPLGDTVPLDRFNSLANDFEDALIRSENQR